MKLIKRVEEYVVNTEEEAIAALERFRDDAEREGYTLGANGYTYKNKKSKGEIIDEAWILKVTKILGGIWE